MRIEALGHVVIRVRDLARAEAFYHGLLGIPISARAPHWSMTFFTLGEHHDLAVSAVGEDALPTTKKTLGLDHIAFRLAGDVAALSATKTRLENAGVAVSAVDHTVSRSLYLHDPDGNLVEIYVNGTDAWRQNPAVILSEAKPLDLAPKESRAVSRRHEANDIEVRVLGPKDGEELLGLIIAFRNHLAAATPTDADFRAQLPRMLADPAIEFACASVGGNAVGYTHTRFYASLWSLGLEALLEDIFVLPSARGQAIGRHLLRHALQRARDRGATLLGLTTNERNKAAHALYRAEGLRPQRTAIWADGKEIRWVAELEQLKKP